MPPLRTPPAHSKRRFCDLCGRQLPQSAQVKGTVVQPAEHQHDPWCRVCRSRHVMGVPCEQCNGAIHHPPGSSLWLGFGDV